MAKYTHSTKDPGLPEIRSGKAWAELCEALRESERFVLGKHVPDSSQMRAEGWRYLTRLFAGGTLICMELADPDYPEFARMVDTTVSWGIDNPDCIYLYSAIRGDATYRIHGNRGTAHHFDVQVNRGHFAKAPEFGVVSSCNGFDLDVAPDDSFELTLSVEPRRGNWLPLAPDAAWILIRQYFNDWEGERPADLVIEREGAKFPPPVLRTDQVAERMELLRSWMTVGAAYWEEMVRYSLDRKANSIYFRPLDETSWGGLRGLAYGFGNFRCKPDQAILLEVTPPRCHYWSFSISNWYWESLDWSRRQTSLNGHQARLDPDGVFRGVIAHRDPGVPNWLDCAGHNEGTILGRYLLTDSAPEVKMRPVRLSQISAELPADTPRVSAAERSEQLEARRRAVSRRNRQ